MGFYTTLNVIFSGIATATNGILSSGFLERDGTSANYSLRSAHQDCQTFRKTLESLIEVSHTGVAAIDRESIIFNSRDYVEIEAAREKPQVRDGDEIAEVGS